MTTRDHNNDFDRDDFERLTETLCAWFVRRDSKYYDVEHLGTKLAKDDVIQIALSRFGEEFDDIELSQPLLKAVFDHAIAKKHSIPRQTIPIWNGREYCAPDVATSTIRERGAVAVNTWRRPAYRSAADVEPDWGVAGEFFDFVFTRGEEKERFLDWLAWCLQNEGDKPNWAPFLYSETKGSGKSTLCRLAARLFGDVNTATQNNVDKLTSRFNAPVLTKKLVICEELHLRQDSPQGNALKTYLTESRIMTERKGQDVATVDHCCCFLFTTNHVPMWIEPDDRRYYIIEIDHDGYATGRRAGEFAALVERLNAFMDDDGAIAGVYRALMDRRLNERFSAKTLNVDRDGTAIMRRVHAASEQTVRAQLRELLDERGQHAVPEADVVKLIREDLGQNLNSTRHVMMEMGWSKSSVKWGGCAYARAIWVRDGYWVEQGSVKGPDNYSQPIATHIEEPCQPETDISVQRDILPESALY